jgi:hypothetical protein
MARDGRLCRDGAHELPRRGDFFIWLDELKILQVSLRGLDKLINLKKIMALNGF